MPVGLKAIMTFAGISAAAIMLPACSDEPEGPDNAYTLYRTGGNAPNARIQWASFSAFRAADKNREDCEMTARIMTANMDAFSAQAKVKQYGEVGFWCEAGPFSTDGTNPAEFSAEYPSNRAAGLRIGE